ncbi:hypothetical protein T07_12469 [Trichinella nelsoni]|uniref:Uncharacterized protein n=1 Tax=Trichinella nelsoni TaxID=6336 RepID=A0A0V0RZU0_9BILA|nr:hypothetical protein T07_12469 [Trichinella nelsoni]
MWCTVFDSTNPVCSAEYHGKEQLSLPDSDSSPELTLILRLSVRANFQLFELMLIFQHKISANSLRHYTAAFFY